MGTVHISSATRLWVLEVGLLVSLSASAVSLPDALHMHCSVSGRTYE